VVWPKVFEAHRRIVMGARLLAVSGHVQREGLVIHLVAEKLWDWSAELDRIAELDEDFRLETGRGDQVRSDRPDPRGEGRVEVPEANATRHRASNRPPAGKRQPYDRSRIHLDRPMIRIHSRDFH
jgi:error-prone DNA polymerase